jgi:hypothetical protein
MRASSPSHVGAAEPRRALPAPLGGDQDGHRRPGEHDQTERVRITRDPLRVYRWRTRKKTAVVRGGGSMAQVSDFNGERGGTRTLDPMIKSQVIAPDNAGQIKKSEQ